MGAGVGRDLRLRFLYCRPTIRQLRDATALRTLGSAAMADDFKHQALECVRLAEECLRLAERIDSPALQLKLGRIASLLVEAADALHED